MESTQKNTILIVDDDAMCVNFLLAVLKDEFKVLVAKNGNDGITTAINYIPDLIILDVAMPDLSGYEVISTLKRMVETKNIPVIFNTSLDTPEEKERGLKLGAVDYLQKNRNPSQVKQRILIQINAIDDARMREP